MNYDEYDYASFDFDLNFTLYTKDHKTYYITGKFFSSDQSLGFEVEDELQSKFFAAIEPKIKKILGKEFVRIEGDPDDVPGVFSILVKLDNEKK